MDKGQIEKEYKSRRKRNLVILLFFALSVIGIIVTAFLKDREANVWGIIASVCSTMISSCAFVFAPGNRKELKWTLKTIFSKSTFCQFITDWETKWTAENPEPKIEDYNEIE